MCNQASAEGKGWRIVLDSHVRYLPEREQKIQVYNAKLYV